MRTVSNRVPSGRLRLTVILTRYRPGAVSGSASIDQFQSGSSSQGASDCEVSVIEPARTSAMRDWASRDDSPSQCDVSGVVAADVDQLAQGDQRKQEDRQGDQHFEQRQAVANRAESLSGADDHGCLPGGSVSIVTAPVSARTRSWTER